MEQKNYFENIYISKHIIFFKESILKTYSHLKNRYDPNKPVIFFGMYGEEDFKTLLEHKSKCLIIWGGSDSLIMLKGKKNISQILDKLLKNKEKVFHIAQSKWISEDLKKLNYHHKLLPWYCLDKSKFKCTKKGDSIYVYLPKKFYGFNLFEKLKKKLNGKYKFIIGGGNLNTEPKIPYDKMPETYSKCFIGLRMVPHDGLGSTVQELGLMGIKCVHNGISPSALNYKTVDDIIKHIENEAKTIGFKDDELAIKVNIYLNIPEDFFKISTYF